MKEAKELKELAQKLKEDKVYQDFKQNVIWERYTSFLKVLSTWKSEDHLGMVRLQGYLQGLLDILNMEDYVLRNADEEAKKQAIDVQEQAAFKKVMSAEKRYGESF